MIKIKKVTERTQIALHPLAKEAFSWLQKYPFLVNHTKLTDKLIYNLSKQYLFAVEQQEDKRINQNTVLRIYAPLPSILFWQNSEPIVGTKIIVDSTVSEQHIEEQAWLSALSTVILSVDKSQIYFLRDSLAKYMPYHCQHAFFSKSKFSYSDICHLTGCSRNTLKQQKRRANEKASIGVISKAGVINFLSQKPERLDADDE